MKTVLMLLALCAASLHAQAPKVAGDPLAPLSFLVGTWTANTQGNAGAAASGSYSFNLELGNHVLARHSSTADCKGPADYDCGHHDLLYVYAEGRALKAIFFDNEGHVIHYDVTVPEPNTAVFVSDAAAAGPLFRLIYVLKGGVMSGKFQTEPPGRTEWESYLEWSGSKK
ncbi:hypothetical protein ACFPT7_02340 [Acidicapsa dinghuensis]|uniref:Lipocalin-like domain-containing protein n=1 Tax=Acidicapsa dinghuensis TaxID=2218256 RepID=A0ABW1E9W7_9BACT|nr:hypothetical protein [Acidicapsa dinghuensis]